MSTAPALTPNISPYPRYGNSSPENGLFGLYDCKINSFIGNDEFKFDFLHTDGIMRHG
jgi:hypothetical protein